MRQTEKFEFVVVILCDILIINLSLTLSVIGTFWKRGLHSSKILLVPLFMTTFTCSECVVKIKHHLNPSETVISLALTTTSVAVM